jgi:hypothetical protein
MSIGEGSNVVIVVTHPFRSGKLPNQLYEIILVKHLPRLEGNTHFCEQPCE